MVVNSAFGNGLFEVVVDDAKPFVAAAESS